MDNRAFISRLAKSSGRDTKAASEMAEKMTEIIQIALSGCDTVAIPGFGSFSAKKTDEHVETLDGHRMLMPPSISVSFKAGSRLCKAVSPLK